MRFTNGIYCIKIGTFTNWFARGMKSFERKNRRLERICFLRKFRHFLRNITTYKSLFHIHIEIVTWAWKWVSLTYALNGMKWVRVGLFVSRNESYAYFCSREYWALFHGQWNEMSWVEIGHVSTKRNHWITDQIVPLVWGEWPWSICVCPGHILSHADN